MSADRGQDAFAYRTTKDGRVLVSWQGRQVTTLAGGRAERFLARTENASPEDRQLELARVTGNFKRGNER